MQTFTFQKIQYGYWGSTDLYGPRKPKQIRIKAENGEQAFIKLRQRKDYHKHLRNGDTIGWRAVDQIATCLE